MKLIIFLSCFQLIGSQLISSFDPTNAGYVYYFAANDDYWFSGSSTNVIQQRFLSNDSILRTWTAHTGAINGLAASGDFLYSASSDKTIKKWNISSGVLVMNITSNAAFNCIVLADDGSSLFSGDSNRTIQQWDTSNGALISTFAGDLGHTGAINSIAVSGDYLVSGSDDRYVKQWQISTVSFIRNITSHSWSVKATICGDFIFTNTLDTTIRQWHLGNGTLSRSMSGYKFPMACSGNNWYYGSAANIRKQDLFNGTIVGNILLGLSSSSTLYALGAKGDDLFAAMDKTLKRWRISSDTLLYSDGHISGVQHVSVFGDNLYSTGNDDTTIRWQKSTKTPISVEYKQGQLMFTNDYMFARTSGGVNQFHLGNGSLVRTYSNSGVMALDGDTIYIAPASGGNFGSWNTRNGSTIRTFIGHSSTITSLAVSGNFVFSTAASSDKSLRQWHISNATTFRTYFVNYLNAAMSVAVSRDFVFAGSGESIYQWNLGNGTLARILIGHSIIVRTLVVVGDYLVSGAGDRYIKFWRMGNGTCVKTILVPNCDEIPSIVIDGYFMYAGCKAETLWLAKTVQQLCQPYSVLSGSTCVCSSEAYDSGTGCVPCPTNSVCTSGTDLTCNRNGATCDLILPSSTTTSTSDSQSTSSSVSFAPNSVSSSTSTSTTVAASTTEGLSSTTGVPSASTSDTATSTSSTSEDGSTATTDSSLSSTNSLSSVTSTADMTGDSTAMTTSSTLTSTLSTVSSSTSSTYSTTATSLGPTTTISDPSTSFSSKTNDSEAFKGLFSIIVVAISSTSIFILLIHLGLLWRARRRQRLAMAQTKWKQKYSEIFFNDTTTTSTTTSASFPRGLTGNISSLSIVTNPRTIDAEAFSFSTGVAESVKRLLLTPDSATAANMMMGCTSTLTFTEGKRGLFVPGHYQVDHSDLKPVGLIFKSPNCDVYCCAPLSEELAKRSAKRVLAVKYLKKKPNETFDDSFKQEISIMHFFRGRPNFVQLVGFNYEPPTIITDLYLNGSLADCMYHKRLIVPTRRLIIRFSLQISSALCEMHLNGFSHSDLKPHNVFVDSRDGEHFCYLGDFGISRVLDDTHLSVKAYKVMNMKGLTARYAAPEMIRMYKSRMEPAKEIAAEFFLKADIYALGLIMFELCLNDPCW